MAHEKERAGPGVQEILHHGKHVGVKVIARLVEHENVWLIEKDAEVFEPLAKAYSIPKDEPGRDEALEKALKTACSAPFEIVMKTKEACEIIVRLETIGSRLALSDVGVAATMLQTAAKGAAMNVYINTKLMKNRSRAEELNSATFEAVAEVDGKCAAVYEGVKKSLTGGESK